MLQDAALVITEELLMQGAPPPQHTHTPSPPPPHTPGRKIRRAENETSVIRRVAVRWPGGCGGGGGGVGVLGGVAGLLIDI